MPDGVELLADRYAPKSESPLPTILIRSPYGRSAPWAWIAALFAERGYATFLQSCRGTFGSSGRFEPFVHEASDGSATLDWLSARPDTGPIAMYGPSYVGFVQWAVAGHPALRAHAMQVTTSEFRTPIRPEGSLSLETSLGWCHTIHHQELPAWSVIRSHFTVQRDLAGPFQHLPLGTADEAALGRPYSFFRTWMTDPPDETYWEGVDCTKRVEQASAPVRILAGWYDIFLVESLRDFTALQTKRSDARLTIGPWSHVTPQMSLTGIREAVEWFDEHLRGATPTKQTAPIRAHLMGADRWLELDQWPPASAPRRLHLNARAELSDLPPGATADPDRFRYDPSDPTPSIGGTILSTTNGGPRDQRTAEARADILVYSTAPLERDVDVVGQVRVELHVATSLMHADIFARLCVVDERGRSVNVCDSIRRLGPDHVADADGVRRVVVELFPTAQRFKKGQRIRLQIAGGAHPRYARNPGTGEPLNTATKLVPCDFRIFRDAARPSSIVLPVYA